MGNPFTVRFRVGGSYRFHTSPSIGSLRGGYFVVKAELRPSDSLGCRSLLVDAYLAPRDGGGADLSRLGAVCFVEEGYATRTDSFGAKTVPVEIAMLQGVYPDIAKAYAVDELPSTTKAA